ncbi:hypothetical protein [Aquimarina agarivorans]|uniref:hypothetical protein n=1 Tax=Aquimarina agarivorans TaxID=980584 RepID=UPI000248EF83|nr:hypothetical protein [Aquimarina agarivorans]
MKKLLLITIVLCSSVTIFAQQKGRFRISIEAGLGYRIAEIPDNILPELEDHIKDLRTGLNIEAHASYFLSSNYGLGIHFSNFSTENTVQFRNGVNLNGTIANETSDDINISFIAPEFLYRSISANGKHSFITSISVGYLSYLDESTINRVPLEIKGGNVGFGLGFMYDYHITPSIAIGANLNFLGGSLRKVDFTANGQTQEIEFEDENRENLSRINLSAGMRFYL